MIYTDKLNNIVQNIFNLIPGPVFGILSVIIGLLGDFLAILFFPDYNLSLMISKLGIGPGGIFFNLGIILSGLFAMPFYVYFWRVLQNKKINNYLLNGALSSALFSCVFFILLGVFPSNDSELTILYLHGIFSTLCFFSALIYFILFNIVLLKSSKFLKLHTYIGFSQATIIILFLFTWNPITEWLMTIGLIVWILSISVYMLYKQI